MRKQFKHYYLSPLEEIYENYKTEKREIVYFSKGSKIIRISFFRIEITNLETNSI